MQGIVKIAQGYGIRRGAYRRADTSQIRCYRDGEGQTYAALPVRRQHPQHRSEESKHHRRSGSIAHEHGKSTYDEQESQKDELRLLSEWFQHGLRQLDIETDLGSRDSQDEAAQKEHDHRVGESRQQSLVAHERPHLRRYSRAFHEPDAAVGYGQKHDHDRQHGSGPGRDDFKHPHQGGEDEDGYGPLLHHGETVDPEEIRRHEPKEKGDGYHQREQKIAFGIEFFRRM